MRRNPAPEGRLASAVGAKTAEVRSSALTIAGSDSGAGAGIQADLRTFQDFGIHGLSVVSGITAQHPGKVLGSEPCPIPLLRKQLQAVFDGFEPRSIKIGALFTGQVVKEVARFIGKRMKQQVPLIVDPVMVSTSGTRLLSAKGEECLQKEIFPLATLITPNVPEAERILKTRISDTRSFRDAARALHECFGVAILLKGGHFEQDRSRTFDLFFDGTSEVALRKPRIRGVKTHGTGCIYASAIASLCARGDDLEKAVRGAHAYVHWAIANSIRVGKWQVLASKRWR